MIIKLILPLSLSFLITIAVYGQERKTDIRKQKPIRVTTPLNKKPVKAAIPKVNTATLEKIKEEEALRRAYNWIAPFKNYGMIPLEGIRNLKSLDLSTGSPIIKGAPRTTYMSDDSLVHLKAFTGLETVVLPIWTRGKGLEHIGEMNWLKSLYLGKTKIGNAGLEKISVLNLEKLIAFEANITNNGVKKIVTYFPNLKILNLMSNPITNDGIAELKQLQQLEVLIISRNNITDQAIPHLLQLSKLRMLSVEFTHLTPEGKNQLRTAFPDMVLID